MTTVAIIQARMGSSRLPGKVLERFAGRTALDHCVTRTRACPAIDEVVIATTTAPGDDVLIDVCRAAGWRWFRGSEHDVLDRYYHAAREVGADTVVRITSDCPLTDPAVIAALIERAGGADYASTSYPRATFPLGISAEVVRFDALAQAWRDDDDPARREHVTPYVYRHPDRFRVVGLACEADHSHHRWTLDTPEDAELLRRIFGELDPASTSWRDPLAIVVAHPDWPAINAAIVQRQAPA